MFHTSTRLSSLLDPPLRSARLQPLIDLLPLHSCSSNGPPDPALNSSSDSEPPPQSLLSDYLASCEPIEATLEELGAIADAHNMHLVMWELTTLLPGETLQQHVLAQQAGGGVCGGPHQEVRGGAAEEGGPVGRCFFGKGACRGGRRTGIRGVDCLLLSPLRPHTLHSYRPERLLLSLASVTLNPSLSLMLPVNLKVSEPACDE